MTKKAEDALKAFIEADRGEARIKKGEPKTSNDYMEYCDSLHKQVEYWKKMYYDERSERAWETASRFGQVQGMW